MSTSIEPGSSWGEPAPAASTSIRAGASPSPNRAAAASAALASSRSGSRWRRRPLVLEERTILVRIIPRTGVFARIRAIFALAVISVAIGLVVAGTLSVIVWGIASALHHASAN